MSVEDEILSEVEDLVSAVEDDSILLLVAVEMIFADVVTNFEDETKEDG
jgi:hypothetical protein